MKILSKIKIVFLFLNLLPNYVFPYPVSYQRFIHLDEHEIIDRCVDLIGDAHIPYEVINDISYVNKTKAKLMRALYTLNTFSEEVIDAIWEINPFVLNHYQDILQHYQDWPLIDSFIIIAGQHIHELDEYDLLNKLRLIPSDYIRIESSKNDINLDIIKSFLSSMKDIFEGKKDFSLFVDEMEKWLGLKFDENVISKLKEKLSKISTSLSPREHEFLLSKILNYENQGGSLGFFRNFCNEAEKAFKATDDKRKTLVFKEVESEIFVCRVTNLEILLNIFGGNKRSIVYCGTNHALAVSDLLEEFGFVKTIEWTDINDIHKEIDHDHLDRLLEIEDIKKYAKEIIRSKVTDPKSCDEILTILDEYNCTNHVISPDAWDILKESPEESYKKHLANGSIQFSRSLKKISKTTHHERDL